MAKLTYAQRKRLPRRSFAVPSERKYPIEDEPHARNALSRVSRYGSPAEKRKVRAAVHRRYPGIRCTSCGGLATHRHGKHGCCGSMGCHHTIQMAHGLAGESGIPVAPLGTFTGLAVAPKRWKSKGGLLDFGRF